MASLGAHSPHATKSWYEFQPLNNTHTCVCGSSQLSRARWLNLQFPTYWAYIPYTSYSELYSLSTLLMSAQVPTPFPSLKKLRLPLWLPACLSFWTQTALPFCSGCPFLLLQSRHCRGRFAGLSVLCAVACLCRLRCPVLPARWKARHAVSCLLAGALWVFHMMAGGWPRENKSVTHIICW